MAAQLRTTVIGAIAVPSTGRFTRNPLPSFDTSYGRPRTEFKTLRLNRELGTPSVRFSPLASVSTAIIVPSGARKKSSFPSRRQRGKVPPFAEIWDKPPLTGGNGLAYTWLRPF